MKPIYFCIILLLSVSSWTYAQLRVAKADKLPIEGVYPMEPAFIISTNVFSLTEPDGGPSLALEYRFNLHWSILVEGTAILYDLTENEAGGSNKGYRIRPEARYYFAGKHKTFRGFFGVEASYKQVDFQEYVTLDHENYYERTAYSRRKKMGGGAFKIGFQTFFDKNRRIIFELYGGAGFKYRHTDKKGMPENVYVPRFKNPWRLDEDGLMPNIPMGVKIGYRL
ncbi:DUF3575 domain-containing protein [Chitinophaga defluvii]|uniref:DUF3575 domain-containing protein n=1 Tax=Chitinophaga defluvii TaxID=3163343 RepID=A0ABV2T2H6_9BACT